MGPRVSLARVPVFLLIGIILSSTPLASDSFPSFQSSVAASPINPPTFNSAAINASMREVLAWAESRVLPNGTATLQGTSNNLWATSLVGRTMTYLQLEIGNTTTSTIIQNMTKAEHILLQNPSFINYGIWPPANLNQQFQVHLDAQKFLSRTYGLTLDPTARSDMINVTQNMHLNLPSRSDYFDTVAWTLSNAVWFAYYSGSPLLPVSDFTTAVQDLNTNYNQTGATSAAADPFIDFAKLLRFLKPITYTDSYFRLEGNSLSQSYQILETGLANQLVKRQLSDGNLVSVNPFQSYLVEDFARDLDSSVYLHNNLTYAYSAYRAESYLTSLYLQSNGNFSLPNNGEGLYPTGAYHMLSIANDLRSCSSNAWYNMLTSSSKLLNYTLTTQYPDGTFRFFLNITNPDNAITTVNTVSGIVDSYLVIRNTSVLSPEIPVNLASCQITSSPSLLQNLSWLYIVVPLTVIIAVAVAYERKHRAKYRGLVEK
jgi:hypothetical protein